MSGFGVKRSFRKHACVVGAVSAAMIAATALTCWHAHRETGNFIFLYSRSVVIADRPLPADSADAAEWDEAMRDAGEPVEQPQRVFMPIVGLLDATLPVIWLGGAWLGLVAIWGLKRR